MSVFLTRGLFARNTASVFGCDEPVSILMSLVARNITFSKMVSLVLRFTFVVCARRNKLFSPYEFEDLQR